MKARAFIFSLILMLTSSFNATISLDTTVYLCMGKGSKKYHYRKNCRGLSNCSTKLHEVSLAKAREMGRTLCGWED